MQKFESQIMYLGFAPNTKLFNSTSPFDFPSSRDITLIFLPLSPFSKSRASMNSRTNGLKFPSGLKELTKQNDFQSLRHRIIHSFSENIS